MRENPKGELNVTLKDIQAAQNVLSRFLTPTPLLHNPWLSEEYGCEVYIKFENMQPIGSFKIRGATYKISQLSEDQKRKGVIAASAGNHAQGVAWGARQLGIKAQIVMPTSAPIVKVQNTRMLGAEIVQEGNNYDEAFSAAQRLMRSNHREFIHAFEDRAVMAGQGTLGLEILSQLQDPDFVLAAVGGGGMITGVATAIRALRPKTKIIGCQAAGAPSMIESIRKGKAVSLKTAATFADGIAVMHPSEKVRKLLAERIDDWVGVSEDAIAAAVLALLEKGKTLSEGSGAVPLAALEKVKSKVRGKKVVLVISGGNIDVNVLSRIIDVGLIKAGRRVRVNVVLSDKPGALAALTQLIASQGANILQAIHDRNEPSTKIDQTEVALTLETRGHQHSAGLIDALRNAVLRLELTH